MRLTSKLDFLWQTLCNQGQHAAIRIPYSFVRYMGRTLSIFFARLPFCAGHVEEVRGRTSADDRTVSVRTGLTDQRRLQSTNERVEPDDPGRATDGRGSLPVSDQH